jgi:glucose/arabinose dehydrogenase
MRRILSWPVAGFVLTASLSAGAPARAASFSPGFSSTTVASGITGATAMTMAPDGRIFVCEQGGALRVIKNGALLATPFVSLSVNALGERGLLGVALDPAFAVNGYVYVYYTTSSSPIHNRISRFTASGDVAVSASEVVLLDLDDLSGATNHNGGAIHFGPDGRLYVAVGENALPSNAQSLTNLLGKVLRINSDGTIPVDNPFYGSTSGRNRAIWALGLRNPFTFAFRPGTGRMFVNDVGASTWEEIDDGIAGSNYGWPQTEGPNPAGASGVRYPLYSYAHDGSTCAIAGGAFYDPASVTFPADYVGSYFFADLCAGWIKRFDPASSAVTAFAAGVPNPVDLLVGADGSLYYLARGDGSVVRVQYTAPPSSSESVGVFRPASATFYLRSSNTTGVSDLPAFQYGMPGDVPVSGDWDGDGVRTVGIFRPSEAAWYLRNSNTTGIADLPPLQYGMPGDTPIAGDWDGDGTDTIGIYRPSTGTFYLRNSNTTGVADMAPIVYGLPDDLPVAGDWNGDGTDTLGVFRPSTGTWYLRNSNTTGIADVPALRYGGLGDLPVVGDWNGDGTDTVGVFRPANGTWYLSDSLTSQGNTILPFVYGMGSDRPVAGKWR